MAGIFGDELNTREDFFKILAQAKRDAASVLRRRPTDVHLKAVNNQIDAIQAWTANGRTPTRDERNKIGMGLRMYREFEDVDDDEIQKLRREAMVLNNYFRHWPDDAAASDPNNDEYL